MTNYRLYLMDQQGDHIDDVMITHADCDEEAVEAAGEITPSRFRELWRLQDKVAAFGPRKRYDEMRFAA